MRIYSIFNSIDGEVNKWGQGTFSTFIRFSGCNLACSFCDTEYARDYMSGAHMDIEEVMQKVKEIGCKKVTITGGEPLLQAGIIPLVSELLKEEYLVSIETNGSIFPPSYNSVNLIMDYKLPSSGMESSMILPAFYKLKPDDYVKFVVGSDEDHKRMIQVIYLLRQNNCSANIAVSPVHSMFPADKLVEKLQEDKIFDCQVNLQLHKYIWPDAKKEV